MLRRWRQDDLDALLRHANDPLMPRGLSDRFPYPYTRRAVSTGLSVHQEVLNSWPGQPEDAW
ncbi:hypothetical protein BER93_16750 [Xanthomonas fragariae]|nr:hypothetical protein BER92_16695 [Xanthomonas fragariae]AOD19452.1 hypothetical protein BER93_16750 [Xanthomonas fragariae]ENZ96945.1 acetyltransferase [Xanthomonas fragariae LMG 25863]